MDGFNLQGRFFAFGCSFTASHDRPTWADIVGQHFAYYQNWARGGMGNLFIFNQLIECNLRNTFNPNDTVMIMWSSLSREDRYVKDQQGWVGHGSVYNHKPSAWLRENACDRGYLIRDLALIAAAKDLLEKWQVNYRFFSMLPVTVTSEMTSFNCTDDNRDVLALYKNVISTIKPSVYEVVFNSQHWNLKQSDFGAWIDPEKTVRDSHPDPKETLYYLSQVLPEFKLPQDTIDWVNNFKFGDIAPQHYLVDRL